MDTLQTIVKETGTSPAQSPDIWLLIALLELLIIIALLVRIFHTRRRKSEKEEMKAKILKEGDIDFGNIINSSFKAKDLYDELKKKCHPDLFSTNEELNAKATEIFALLVKNKHDYAALCQLKKRAEQELNIHF